MLFTTSSAVIPSVDEFADDQDRVTFINRLGSVFRSGQDTAPFDAEKHFYEVKLTKSVLYPVVEGKVKGVA